MYSSLQEAAASIEVWEGVALRQWRHHPYVTRVASLVPSAALRHTALLLLVFTDSNR